MKKQHSSNAELTVLIPSFNGGHLLKKNLPVVLSFIKKTIPNAPVIVYDDGSSDATREQMHQFPEVEYIASAENHGFARAVNAGMRAVRTPYVLLLNNDVIPIAGLRSALGALRSRVDWFAVSARQQLPGEALGGAALPEFKHGLLRHVDAFGTKRDIHPFPIMYPSGGAALIRVEYFRALGGFEALFSPFYWEDADLGWRAWHKGWASMCAPGFSVLHDHSPTIKGNFSRYRVHLIATRNLFLFNWRAFAGWRVWAVHCAYVPLHLLRAILSLDIAFLHGLFTALIRIHKIHHPRYYSFWDVYRQAGGK